MVSDPAACASKTLVLLKGKTLLVEGKHDSAALKRFGLEAKIAFEPAWRFAEANAELQTQEVVLLFDFDAEGLRKERAFFEALIPRGVNVRRDLRHRVRRAFGVRTVEELPTRLAQIQAKGEKNGQNVRGHSQVLD